MIYLSLLIFLSSFIFWISLNSFLCCFSRNYSFVFWLTLGDLSCFADLIAAKGFSLEKIDLILLVS